MHTGDEMYSLGLLFLCGLSELTIKIHCLGRGGWTHASVLLTLLGIDWMKFRLSVYFKQEMLTCNLWAFIGDWKTAFKFSSKQYKFIQLLLIRK